MLLDRQDLSKLLRVLSAFDQTSSPYISVQLTDGKPEVYRSSSYGLLQSKQFDPNSKLIHVSLSSFVECLKAVSSDQIMLGQDASGFLRIDAGDSLCPDILRVHTVALGQTGLKYHDVGIRATALEARTFAGLNTKVFSLAQPPILMNGQLLLSTFHGSVIWTGSSELNNITLMPRSSFLDLLSGVEVEQLFLTSNGYWTAVAEGFVFYVKSHELGRNIFAVYSAKGPDLVKFPAARLTSALNAAAGLANKNNVIIVPKRGVVTRDKFGNESVFSLGLIDGFDRFSMTAATAKLIVDAFLQAKEEEAVLSSVPSGYPTLRLTRGPLSVIFKVMP